MCRSRQPLVYTIGLEPLTARAIAADLAHAVIRRQKPLRPNATRRGRLRRPDLVLIDVTVTAVVAELAAAWAAWGERVVIVGIGRSQPYGRVWRRRERHEVIEVGPGFLAPYLPAMSWDRMPGRPAGSPARVAEESSSV